MITKFKIFENKLILEKSFYDINSDEIFTDDFIKKIMKEDFIRDEAEVYRDNKNISDDVKDLSKYPEFIEYIKQQLYDNYDKFCQDFEFETGWTDDKKLKIFREITVKDNYIEHLKTSGKHLGKFWTYDEEFAEAYWGDFDKPHVALLTACVDEEHIDWIETIRKNVHPDYHEEREITLFRNTPIKLLNIYINKEEVELDKELLNKIFYA
jgi:hypothetical protein